jgi:hypothetical protein
MHSRVGGYAHTFADLPEALIEEDHPYFANLFVFQSARPSYITTKKKFQASSQTLVRRRLGLPTYAVTCYAAITVQTDDDASLFAIQHKSTLQWCPRRLCTGP